MITKLEKASVLETIFFNPFCTKRFIISLTGLSYYKTTSIIESTRGVLKLSVPAFSPRHYQAVYFLDDKAQREAIGISRHPVDLSYAFGMTYARLQRFRTDAYDMLSHAQKIAWMISPWKLDQRGIYLDGLLCVQDSKGSGYLQGVLIASEAPSIHWCETILECLKKWRAYNQRTIPFELVFFDAPSPQIIHKAAHLVDIGDNASIKIEKGGRISSARTSTMIPIPAIRLRAKDFLANTRSHHRLGYKMEMTPMEWCNEYFPEIGTAAEIRSNLTWLQLRILLSIIKRPGLTPVQHRKLLDPDYTRHDFLSEVRQIVECNAAGQLDETQGLFITDMGIETFSLIYGTASPVMNEYYGHPPTKGREMVFLRHHHALIAEVMLSWQQAGIVSSWQSTAREHMFKLPSEVASRAKENTIIAIDPDITGTLNMRKGKKVFWIELDRGSKFSEDLYRQLKKYVLAGLSYQRTQLPITLWIVSDRRRFHSTRLRKIIEYTQRAYSQFPASATILAFTHIDILKRIKTKKISKTDNWLLLSSATAEPQPTSLEALFLNRTLVTSTKQECFVILE